MSEVLDPAVARPRHIIELFLRIAPADLAALVAATDAESLQQAAHKIKGTAAMLGLRSLATSCRAIDTLAKQGDFAGGRALVGDAERDFQLTCDALRAELS